MKVKLGNYLTYWGPYQIAELLMFWEPRYSVRAHEFGKWLAGDEHETWLSKVCQWIYSKRKRTVKIKLDRWDTWNMDDTLSLIILPLLKQLQRDQHGSAIVDPEDVPEDLPKMTKLMVDGKALYIHRANYQIIDKKLL